MRQLSAEDIRVIVYAREQPTISDVLKLIAIIDRITNSRWETERLEEVFRDTSRGTK